MALAQFTVSWDPFKSSVFRGFSALQRNEELVDMTLAADGHYVKVHQVLIALASPYLKNLLASAPCQHPVIFLNNVSREILCLILEYIYTGEVKVPVEKLSIFIETARSLHIMGIDNLQTDESLTKPINKPQSVQLNKESFTANTLESKNEILVTLDKTEDETVNVNSSYSKESNEMGSNEMDTTEQLSMDQPDFFQVDSNNENDDVDKTDDASQELLTSKPHKLHYTVSNRGSLQVILNRYIYTLHYEKVNGIRRWRCSDNRETLCKATVDTKGPLVINRIKLHNHPYHDKRILKKANKKSIFASVEEVESSLKQTK